MSRPRVLVVGDNRHLTKLLSAELARENIDIVEASTAWSCLKRVITDGADLILLDTDLPDFNGWYALGALKLMPLTQQTPVIVVSAEEPNSVRAKPFRPDDHIQKPFDTRDLIVRVRKLLPQGPANT